MLTLWGPEEHPRTRNSLSSGWRSWARLKGLEFEIDANGVFQVYRCSVVGEGGPNQHFQSTEYAHWSVGQGKAPVFQVPSPKEYSVDLDQVLGVVAHGPTKYTHFSYLIWAH